MSRYVVSPRASADLEDIWDYTAERWGAAQAEEYSAIETVADDPRKGRSCDEVREGYRKYGAGSHVLFYRSVKAGIDILRILHGRMDFEQHL
jgi:toxin ParE1/3/4